MPMEGEEIVVGPDGTIKYVKYALSSVGRRSKIYLMTMEPMGTSKATADVFKEQVVDVSEDFLETAVRRFIETAYKMGLKKFYIEAGDGDLLKVEIVEERG